MTGRGGRCGRNRAITSALGLGIPPRVLVSRPGWVRRRGTPLDPQLDFTHTNPYFTGGIEQRLESYYDPFTVHPRRDGLEFLRGWQRVGRFGATALTLATLLTLVGLAIGTRRSRAGVVLFGLGGLALIITAALGGTYAGRYTVPMAGPLMAAAAIALLEMKRRLGSSRQRRRRRTRRISPGPRRADSVPL